MIQAFRVVNALLLAILVFSMVVAMTHTVRHLTPLLRARRDKHAYLERRFPKPLRRYGYVKLHEDKFGSVWQLSESRARALIIQYNGQELVRIMSLRRLVEVKDSSTGEKHWLGVPLNGDTVTGKGAVAWTFSLRPDQYHPSVET